MQASAQLPADEHIPHTAAMLPVASSFDRELRVKMVDYYTGEEHEKVVKVPCKKPAQSRKPTVAELDRLAPLERALEAAIEARRLRFDAESLALKEALQLRGYAWMPRSLQNIYWGCAATPRL